jgi:phage terminase large subunit
MDSPRSSDGALELPQAFRPLFQPSRYKVYYGGRGSAKSWTFARALVHIAARVKVRVLCAREIQNSIADSVHRLLTDTIDRCGYREFFDVTEKSIVSHMGADFLFKGLRHNIREIKSTEGIDICWVEEGQGVSDPSWKILIPTVRNPGSEIWCSFNPDSALDPTYKRFVTSPPDDAFVQKVSWRDNPWFPSELEKERLYLQRVDPEAYANVWEGECATHSAAQIFKGKYEVYAFDVPPLDVGHIWDGPYQGADWGFSVDPSCLVRLWIKDRMLFIEHETYAVGCDTDKLPDLFDRIPDARKYVTRADSARPETISYMNRHGYNNVAACEKWPECVEDGVAFIRQFEKIIIHPRCVHALEEARLYSYKVDRLTGDVLRDVADKHNHIWDSVRYALEPLITAGFGKLRAQDFNIIAGDSREDMHI